MDETLDAESATLPTRQVWILIHREEQIGSYDSREEAIEDRELRCGINQRDEYSIVRVQ